jgi:hypothetical protein
MVAETVYHPEAFADGVEVREEEGAVLEVQGFHAR